jgi:hypothetical protein
LDGRFFFHTPFFKQGSKIFAGVAAAGMENRNFVINGYGNDTGGKDSGSLFFRFGFVIFDIKAVITRWRIS